MLKRLTAVLLTICAITVPTACKPIDTKPVVPVDITVEDFESGKDAEVPPSHTTPPLVITPPETTAIKAPEFARVRFAAAGDNLIHSSIYKQAASRSENGGYDFSYAYENVAGLISGADIAMLNQETLICNDEYEPSTYPLFNSPKALGDHMLDIGFDVFTIANNHTLDKGVKGLLACLDYWDARENAVVAGAYRNAADRDNIRTNEVNGITFSYLSYTEYLNGLTIPEDSDIIIGNALDIELMESEIKKADKISDICVVALHWGVENSDVITDYQRQTAKRLSEAGADIIIGTHPHVLRNIELIDRSDGSQTICAYSLGNFISAQDVGQRLIGGVLQFDIMLLLDDTAQERDKRPVFTGIEFIPVITHYDRAFADLRLYKLSDYTPELADSHGVKTGSAFSYDFIIQTLEKNIDERFLKLS